MNFNFSQGDAHSSFEPRKVEVLCKKNIVDIAFGSGPHVLAVSKSKFNMVLIYVCTSMCFLK